MARNFTVNLFIDLYLKPGTLKNPDHWVTNIVDNVFARDDFFDYCDIKEAKRVAKCNDHIDKDGHPVIHVFLEYLNFNIGGDHETDYDKLLTDIATAITQKLDQVTMFGSVRFSGYDDDRHPDISSYALLGSTPERFTIS